jgi:naphthalene 1,2-dioxygenase system ferredoxin subunit
MTTCWTLAADAATVRELGLVGVLVEGRDVAFYLVDEEIFATDNQCTHGQARLTDGFLLGNEIECPLHQGRFDVRSGKAMCEPLQACVRAFPVKIEDGKVFVALDEDVRA